MRGGLAQGAVPRQRQDGVCSTTLWAGPKVTAIKGGVRTPSDRVRGRFQPLSGGSPFRPQGAGRFLFEVSGDLVIFVVETVVESAGNETRSMVSPHL